MKYVVWEERFRGSECEIWAVVWDWIICTRDECDHTLTLQLFDLTLDKIVFCNSEVSSVASCVYFPPFSLRTVDTS